jgi:hypothetical protein
MNQNKRNQGKNNHDGGECEPSKNEAVPPTARCPVAPATRLNIAGFHGDRTSSARSAANRRYVRLFSKLVPKIVTCKRIHHYRDQFMGLQWVTAVCFANIFGNIFLQFRQARIITNWRCRLKPFARARILLLWAWAASCIFP